MYSSKKRYIILRPKRLLFFIFAVFSISCGFTQDLKNHDSTDNISAKNLKHLQGLDEFKKQARNVERLTNEAFNELKSNGSISQFNNLIIKNFTSIVKYSNKNKSKFNVSNGRLRKYKTRNHKKLKGKSKRLKKEHKNTRLIDIENGERHQIFRSFDARNIQADVEKELTKNLEKEIIQSRFNNLINKWDNLNINDIDNNSLAYRNNLNSQHVNKITEFDLNNIGEKFLDGDISCMKGKFIPAPLIPHALIKYVKSSQPGHEYLEANYRCTSEFSLSPNNSRLVCKNRKWIGELPSCLDKNLTNSCIQLSCDHICIQVNGQAKCSCHEGFYLKDDKCVDINECEELNGGCQFDCINTPGSFNCTCPKGMKTVENKFTCEDINECLSNNGHGPCQDTCKNIEKGYLCSCEKLPGTILDADNHTCQETNSCAFNNAGCSHTCLSTIGRIFCLCPDGFILKDDWKTCEDVDECAVPELQNQVCRYGCINTPGSYHCTDAIEYQTDESKIDICPLGYREVSESTCEDINECEENNGECSEVCENTNGSYFCACNGDERILSSDGKSCSEINAISCSSLSPVKKGSLVCSRPNTHTVWPALRSINRPGSKCYLKCPRGYQLLGQYELTCRENGSWEGIKTGECIKSSQPHIECPKDIIAEVPADRDEAFVRFDQPSTDIDWFRYVRSKPSWGMRLEASLKPGLYTITFLASHPVSRIQSSCNLHIIIEDGEPPKALNCPEDIIKKNGTSITWIEPIFTDNIKVTRVSSNELNYSYINLACKKSRSSSEKCNKCYLLMFQSPGRSFDIGEWKIVYEASDDAGWTSNCTFNVKIQQD